MKKYIIILLIFFVSICLSKNIEGFKNNIIPRKEGKEIFDKCQQQQKKPTNKHNHLGYWPSSGGCYTECIDSKKIDGNCGNTLYQRPDGLGHYKLCGKTCPRSSDTCRYSKNQCGGCYPDIFYKIPYGWGNQEKAGIHKFKCGTKVNCPDSSAPDGCGAYPMNDIGSASNIGDTNIGNAVNGNDTNIGNRGSENGNILVSETDNYTDDNIIGTVSNAKKSNKDIYLIIDNNFSSKNNIVDCSTYPNHPKCNRTNNMLGCINNSNKNEINSMSKIGTLDSSWGLFN